MKKIYITLLLTLVVPALYYHRVEAAVVCTDLSVDFGSGVADSVKDGKVIQLQRFLKDQGYLSATPNGFFGPATLLAVKQFQTAEGFFATGYVGPLTRARIKTKSCVTTQSQTPTPTPVNIPAAAVSKITNPQKNDTWLLGKTYTITWEKELFNRFDIVLENEQGVAQGFITSDSIAGKSFVWKAGTISLSNSDKTPVLGSGLYRIRIQDSSNGRGLQDQVSDWFTLKRQPMNVTSSMPSRVVFDSESALVLYGSGFTQETFLYLDNIRSLEANKLYVSGDGKVLVYALQKGTSVGTHTISLGNGYDVLSNAATVTVTDL